jgi:hypothetical protein
MTTSSTTGTIYVVYSNVNNDTLTDDLLIKNVNVGFTLLEGGAKERVQGSDYKRKNSYEWLVLDEFKFDLPRETTPEGRRAFAEKVEALVHTNLQLCGALMGREANTENFCFSSRENPERIAASEWKRIVFSAFCQAMAAIDGAKLVSYGPSQQANRMQNQVLSSLTAGDRIILAELCPRFGKTPWALSVADCTQHPVVIIGAYWLSALSSFENDCKRFEQFRNMVIVRASDLSPDDLDAEVRRIVEAGKQAVVLLSLCGEGSTVPDSEGNLDDPENDTFGNLSTRDARIASLFGLPYEKIMFIDEADYGAHTPRQVEPLKRFRKSDDPVILMTGTNGMRAKSAWNIDAEFYVTYAELLEEKHNRQP